MTREEKAIIYFKDMRKRMCEDYLNICPKDSVAYKATLAEKDFYDIAIKALEQQSIDKSAMMYEIYMNGVNMSGEYQGCWVRFKDIEKIVDKYMAESEVQDAGSN